MLFSKKDLTKLILPLLIEQALAVFIGMVDTVMVAQAGEAAVSGVSLVDSVNLLLLYFIGSLATGGAIVISHAIGAKDTRNINNSAKQLLWISFILGSFLGVLMAIFRRSLLKLIFGAVSAEIMANAQIYFLFTALSYPFLALRNAGAAIYRSFGNSKISMYSSFLTNIINICGNALLIFGFHMGAAGAAIATLFSRIIGAVVMIYLLCDKRRSVYIDKIWQYRPDFRIIKRILGLGIPNGFEGSMFQFGKVITQSIVSTFGSVAIAANVAANTFCSMMYVPGNAIGSAMTTVVGRCIGAEEKAQAKKYALRLLGLVYILVIAFAVIMSTLSPQLIGTLNISPEAETIGIRLFIFHNICMSLVWPVAFSLPNSFRAASDVRYTMVISISSMWLFRVGCGYILANFFGMGVWGIWIGMGVDWVFRAAMFAIRYLNGKWLTKYKKIA